MRDSGDHERGEGKAGVGAGIGVGIGIIQDIINNPQNQSGQGSDNHKIPKKPDKAKTTAKTLPSDKQPKTPVASPPATPPTTTTTSPPTTTDNTPPTAPGPPGTTTGDNPPNPHAGVLPPQDPHDLDVPRTPYGHDVPPECPQRGMGCAALVIDFETHYLGDLAPLRDHLIANKACDVEYFASKFLNRTEWERLTQAIERHRARVARGADLAIEIIRGEGYPAELRTCGSVGPSDGRSLDRQEFVDGNYAAANKHVCGWVMADFSCHSGYTPQAFDEINNGAMQTPSKPNADGSFNPTLHACVGAQRNDCALHAGYDFDVAMGQSSASLPACALFTPALRSSLADVLVQQGKSIKFDQSWRHIGFGSYYSDQGYRYCSPVVREGYRSEPPAPPGKPDTIAPVGATTSPK